MVVLGVMERGRGVVGPGRPSLRPKTSKLDHPATRPAGDRLARRALVAPGNRRALAHPVPGRSDDACEPRNYLPISLRPGAW